jgi:hypothetical protein
MRALGMRPSISGGHRHACGRPRLPGAVQVYRQDSETDDQHRAAPTDPGRRKAADGSRAECSRCSMTVPLYRQGLLGVFDENLAVTIGRTRRQSSNRSGPGSTHAAANSCEHWTAGRITNCTFLPTSRSKSSLRSLCTVTRLGRCCRPIRSIRAWVAKPRAC